MRAASEENGQNKLSPDSSASPMRKPGRHQNYDLSQYASTTDMTHVLDEREKRLQIKEELIRCKEQMLGLHQQNERLKREISNERSVSYSQMDSNNQRSDIFSRSNLQA